MEEDTIKQNNVPSIEYREMMETQLAKDFWFMNIKPVNEWEDGFSYSKNCVCMEWGNGWLSSFYDLCRQLLTEVKSNFQWMQLKEKFGAARCYYGGNITPYGIELINHFEYESQYICEHCGKPGKIIGNGWYMCLCDECYKKSQER